MVKEINKTKPVVILKGGLTESGNKAVASHTGSMAGETQFWDAFFKQTGAIRAYSLEDMAHTVMALLHLPETKGRGVTVFGTGGGCCRRCFGRLQQGRVNPATVLKKNAGGFEKICTGSRQHD